MVKADNASLFDFAYIVCLADGKGGRSSHLGVS
jgi:hypothetical protein